MQKRKGYGGLRFFLWSGFLFLTAVIVFLSLQDGDKAKMMTKVLMEWASQYVKEDLLTGIADKQQAEYLLRQAGRAGVFFLLGILGTGAVHLTFRRLNALVRTILIIGVLTAIACLTEKVKLYLPSRHFSETEMLVSMAFVILGFGVTTVGIFLVWLVKKVACLLRIS